jgi:2-desacetyl-2-hydroxyethyl bacteriochlorophyllide A dehydrogenase
MKAVRFDGPGRISLGDLQQRDLGDNEVGVAIDRVGICATDLHIFHGTFPTATYPITPGHEATGVVARVGAAVEGLTVGTRVVLDPGIPCRRCPLCRRGRFNLCVNRRAFGVTENGAATAELVAPVEQFLPMAASTPADAAVLGEPLACVVHAFDLVPPPGGSSVLIFGAGTVGLLATILARQLNAAHVAVVDLNEGRLDRARAVGAHSATTSSAGLAFERFDLVIDATGAPPAIADGIARVERGGAFLQIGVAHPEALVDLSPYQIFARELTVAGSLTTRNSFPRAVAMLDAGVVDHTLFTGSPLSLDRYSEAIAAAEGGATPKVTVSP